MIAGFVTGLFSLPEGMAYASLGGFAAPMGLWSGIVPTMVGSVFTRTTFMITTVTSAIALTGNSVLASAGIAPNNLGAIATLTVMVGIVMLVFGLLHLGSAMAFVSTAVMTGFTTGIALQIVAGVISDTTGYSPHASNTIGKFVDALSHVGHWDLPTVLVAAGTVVAWALLHLIKPIRRLAILIALVIVTGVTMALSPHIKLVSDIAAVPRSLPPFSLPDLSAVPTLAVGAVAIALVALAQSTSIGSAVPNPDEARPDASRDFVALGIANIAGGFFSALPTGGSLSRTGVTAGAGARSRWAGIFAGAWLAVIVLAVGPLAGNIPMAVIGGLMLIIGIELIAGRLPDIVLVARTSWLSSAAMLITFLATTQLPLQQALFIGAGVAIVLAAVSVSRLGSLMELVPSPSGGWLLGAPPATLPSGRTTVLHYSGVGFFAEVSRIDRDWPDASQTTDAAFVLSLRGAVGIPSATFVKAFGRQVQQLRARGIPVVICGIPPRMHGVLAQSHVLDVLGEGNVFESDAELMTALQAAHRRAEELRASARYSRPREER